MPFCIQHKFYIQLLYTTDSRFFLKGRITFKKDNENIEQILHYVKFADIGAAEESKMESSGIERIELFLNPIKTLGIHLSYHKQFENKNFLQTLAVTKIIYLALKNDSNNQRIKNSPK